ncbi:MAG: HDIG domain-containing protein [Methanoregula sp.]|nr:HDIG domain-containing protein [Methanoregula sp.]
MERSAAIDLLFRYVRGPGLQKHCLATGAVMKSIARSLGEDTDLWETIGILHDIDYELIHEDMQQHGAAGAKILIENGIDPDIAHIIERHNHKLFSGTYDRPVEIALQAADSVSGLVIACALVKGGKLSEVTVKTVTKKVKEKSFAVGCDRNRIALGAALLPLPDLYSAAIEGLMSIRGELELT